MRYAFFLIASFASVNCFASAASADGLPSRYFLTDLERRQDGYNISINNFGQVAETIGSQPKLWTPTTRNGQTGTWTVLPTPTNSSPFGSPLPAGAMALDLNDYGQVAGNVGTFEAGGKPYLWTPAVPNGQSGAFVTLSTTVSDMAAAYGINNLGQLVIYRSNSNTLWTPNAPNAQVGTFTLLPSGGPNYPGAYKINDRGEIGFSSTQSEDNWVFRPAVPNGTTGSLAPVPGNFRDINDDGWVASMQGLFVPTESGYVRVDGSPLGIRNVNNAGVAITTDARVWTAGQDAAQVMDRLESHSGKNWTIEQLRDINDLGQIVADGLYDADGDPNTDNAVRRSLLLTPLIEGDANIDQKVDFDDLLVVAAHFGQSGNQTWNAGDFDGSDSVDFLDLLSLAQHYGTGTSNLTQSDFPSDWQAARSVVPEPIGFMVIAPSLVARRRRR